MHINLHYFTTHRECYVYIIYKLSFMVYGRESLRMSRCSSSAPAFCIRLVNYLIYYARRTHDELITDVNLRHLQLMAGCIINLCDYSHSRDSLHNNYYNIMCVYLVREREFSACLLKSPLSLSLSSCAESDN